MSIAHTVEAHLDSLGLNYERIDHPPTFTSMEAAHASHVPGDQLAKSVVLEDEDGYVMAVIPASHRLQIGNLSHLLNRRLGLATETELAGLFDDCYFGAVPATGRAYGVEIVCDDSLMDQEDIYFEAGDHQELVHMDRTTFRQLMAREQHGTISRHL